MSELRPTEKIALVVIKAEAFSQLKMALGFNLFSQQLNTILRQLADQEGNFILIQGLKVDLDDIGPGQ